MPAFAGMTLIRASLVRTQILIVASNDKGFSEQLAPLFLEFGKAVYICQCFESTLCFLLSLMSHEQAQGEEGAFLAAWDFHTKKTLGQLVKLLRERIDVPEDLDEYLGVGVDKRNEIVHGFLTKNANRWMDPKGRLELERELVELKLEVKRRDIVANRLLDGLLKKYGLSNDILKRNADRLWDHLNPEESSSPSAPKH